MFNVVLVYPQIPNNTGSIGRLCVNTGATLHLIEPLGFDINEKALRRAGLDYWQKLNPRIWSNLEEFFAHNDTQGKLHLATTKTDKPYFEADFEEGDYLLFGSETAGLPQELLNRYSQAAITIPMTKEGRSLNLAVSTGIVLYEAIKQNFQSYQAYR
jgi:tRNA (cytidine/uridine-2'-O-)-methyltransferase